MVSFRPAPTHAAGRQQAGAYPRPEAVGKPGSALGASAQGSVGMGGGGGRGEEKPLADGQGFVRRLLEPVSVRWTGYVFCAEALMRFSAYPLPPGRGWRDWLLPRSLIQDSTAAFASSVAARCVVALSVTSATMLPLPLIENRRALPCKAGGSGCPSFAAEVGRCSLNTLHYT